MVMDFVVTSQMPFLRCVKQNASILDNVQTPNVTGWYVWYLSNCQVMLARVPPNCTVFYLKRQVLLGLISNRGKEEKREIPYQCDESEESNIHR